MAEYVRKNAVYTITLRHGSYMAATKISNLSGINVTFCLECERHGNCRVEDILLNKCDMPFCSGGKEKEK